MRHLINLSALQNSLHGSFTHDTVNENLWNSRPELMRGIEKQRQDFAEALKAAKLEYLSMVGDRKSLTFREMYEIRLAAKAKTKLNTDDVTHEEAAWKAIYGIITDQLRETHAETMREIEKTEDDLDKTRTLRDMMIKKLQAHPNDYGRHAMWGFPIIGLLVGWLRSQNLISILVHAVVFSIAGLLFALFALDSADVQSRTAILLSRLGLNRIPHWLYQRALTLR